MSCTWFQHPPLHKCPATPSPLEQTTNIERVTSYWGLIQICHRPCHSYWCVTRRLQPILIVRGVWIQGVHEGPDGQTEEGCHHHVEGHIIQTDVHCEGEAQVFIDTHRQRCDVYGSITSLCPIWCCTKLFLIVFSDTEESLESVRRHWQRSRCPLLIWA